MKPADIRKIQEDLAEVVFKHIPEGESMATKNPSRNPSSPMTTMTASGRGQNRPLPGRPAGTGDARGTAKLPNISRTTPGGGKKK